MGLDISLQGQPKVRRKQNVPILAALAVINEDLAAVQVNVADSDVDQLAHAHRGIEHQLQHKLMLRIAALLNRLKEFLEFSQRQ